MTYGQVGRAIGIRDARIVGWAMHANTDPKVFCHRVVNKSGGVAESYAFGGWEEQKQKLMEEGVAFVDEKHVDLSKHLLKI